MPVKIGKLYLKSERSSYLHCWWFCQFFKCKFSIYLSSQAFIGVIQYFKKRKSRYGILLREKKLRRGLFTWAHTHITSSIFLLFHFYFIVEKIQTVLVGWQRLLYFKHRTDSNNEYDISFDSGNISNTFALSMFAGYQSNDDHYSLGHKILLQCKYFKVHWLQI